MYIQARDADVVAKLSTVRAELNRCAAPCRTFPQPYAGSCCILFESLKPTILKAHSHVARLAPRLDVDEARQRFRLAVEAVCQLRDVLPILTVDRRYHHRSFGHLASQPGLHVALVALIALARGALIALVHVE